MRTYKSIGDLYYKIEKYDEVVQSYLKALQIEEIASKKQDQELAEMFYELSYLYEMLQDYAKALKYVRKQALPICLSFVMVLCMIGTMMIWFTSSKV